VKTLFLFLSSVFLAAAGSAQEKPETGKITDHVTCIGNSEQSYAVFLPSTYSEARSWPVVLAFDPGARGQIPVELMKDGAERYGYIVLGSNNSRNGAWKIASEAAEAMLQDAQKRFNVDLKRIYFAGFSGGARVASELAQLCKCAAGVLLSGAGFSQHSSPQNETAFPVFSTAGLLDFNYPELITLQDKLEQAAYPHWLRVFDGQHEWAPAAVMNEAFAWFRVQAMREKREPRDDKLISVAMTEAVASAEKYIASKDMLAAWRQYKQIAETYNERAEAGAARTKSEELGKSKQVQAALKSERNMFGEQERWSNQILGALQSEENLEAPRSAEQNNVTQDIRDLRQRSESEKKPERAVVLKRALSGIFVGAIESGGGALEKKEYATAARYFLAAAEARPSAEWPLRQLAIAQALTKDSKAAIETLRRIKPTDTAEFQKWLAAEPAFAELRGKGALKEVH